MSFVTDIFGGDNEHEVKEYKVDDNSYEYGGAAGGADEAANRYRSQAEGAQGRQGVQVNYDQANQDRNLGMQARAGQSRLAGAMEARAMGQVPSIAQMQADRQMGQAASEQASAAASARGPAALALSQQNAAANVANAQSNISGQAQINAAQERERAEQAAMGAHSQMRAGDAASQQMSAQQSQYQAGMDDSQRGRNDAMTMGMTGFETGVRNSQMTGQMNKEAQKSGNANAAEQMRAQIAEANAQRRSSNALGVTSAAAGAASASDERAKVPLSTWGTGKGLDDEGVGEFLGKLQADNIRNELDAQRVDARLGVTGGGQAVDFDAVSRINRDEAAKTRAYEARNLPVSDRAKQNAEIADKSSKSEPGGFARAMGAASKGLAAAAGRQGATIGGYYAPPTLIPISGQSRSDAGAKIDIGGLSGINDLPGGGVSQPQKKNIKTPTSYSDERAKEVLPLMPGPRGEELHVNDAGRAFYAQEEADPLKASFSGPSSVSKGGGGAAERAAARPRGLASALKAKPAERKMTDDELAREADKMMAEMRTQHEAQLSGGSALDGLLRSGMEAKTPYVRSGMEAKQPVMLSDEHAKREAFMDGIAHAARMQDHAQGNGAEPEAPDYMPRTGEQRATPTRNVGGEPVPMLRRGGLARAASHAASRASEAMANANRSQEASAYAYKPEFTPPEQEPGEPNVGPMAQNLAKDPIASTAVKRDPNGLMMLDTNKLLKLHSGGIANLQKENDDLRAQLSTLASRMRGTK